MVDQGGVSDKGGGSDKREVSEKRGVCRSWGETLKYEINESNKGCVELKADPYNYSVFYSNISNIIQCVNM